MKTEWIRDNRHAELLIFFNGWGMDRAALEHIDLGRRDLLHCYDYRETSCPIDFDALADRYRRIHLVAWSLGVAIAARTCGDRRAMFSVKLAVSGTVPGIDDAQGIPVDAFQATIDGMTARGRSRFHRRITEDRKLQAALDRDTDRPLSEVCDELRAIRDRLRSEPVGESIFDVAMIGDRDRIFPPRGQVDYWLGRADIRIVHGLPHMPIRGKVSLNEMVERYVRD